MRALTLTQPWASAMALGLKQWETRSWKTSYRGRIAIHAAKSFPPYAQEMATRMGFKELPFGQILCVGEIVDCQPTAEIKGSLSPEELSWGDYADGRWAFQFKLTAKLDPFISVGGALSLWEIPEEIWQELRVRYNW